MAVSGRHVSLRDFDWLMLGVVLVIAALGVLQIYSTTADTRFAGAHQKQLFWILLGLVGFFLMSWFDYRQLLNFSPWVYFAVLLVLACTLLFGTEVMGARRWIRIGSFTMQISEFAKLAVILLLARFFNGPQEGNLSWPDVAKVGAVAGIPAFLIAVQPDLGTALTFVPIVMIVLFVAGLKLRYFAFMFLAGILAMPIAWQYMKPYQKERIATFLNPQQDPQRSGYQVLQSKIAVGSGQLWGKGMAQGTQTQLSFLPVPHTDFIFAAFAEEHGFLGVLFCLMLYFFLIIRLVQNAQMAPDTGGMFLILGFVGVLLFQFMVNVGMVVGHLPVTGIPLPLMSYGGSSALSVLLSLGLVNSVKMRRFVN